MQLWIFHTNILGFVWGLWAAPAWGHKAFISTKDQGFHPSKAAKAENGQRQTCPSRSTLCPPPHCTASWWPAPTGPSGLWLSDGLASGRRQQASGWQEERAGWLPPSPSLLGWAWLWPHSCWRPYLLSGGSLLQPPFLLLALTPSSLAPSDLGERNAFPSIDCTSRPALTRVKVPSVNLHATCFLPGPCPVHFQTKKPTIEERAAPSHQNLLVLPAVSHTVPAPSPGDYHLSSIPTGLPFLECHTNRRDPRRVG